VFGLFFFFIFYFFFQAEDGIRDFHVTGVQTCALPILYFAVRNPKLVIGFSIVFVFAVIGLLGPVLLDVDSPNEYVAMPMLPPSRSEERRVGKECRSRGWRDP